MIIHLARTLLAALRPDVVQAHCDTADGPAVTAGRTALQTGNLNHALVWVAADAEEELRDVFDQAQEVRTLGPVATEVADRLFLETLVRLHRMAEGVGFTGIKPAGTPVDRVVAAADHALSTGSDVELLALVAPDRRPVLHERFEVARSLREVDPDDVEAGRRSLAAYVSFVGYAEGDDHEHAVGHDRKVALPAHSHQH